MGGLKLSVLWWYKAEKASWGKVPERNHNLQDHTQVLDVWELYRGSTQDVVRCVKRDFPSLFTLWSHVTFPKLCRCHLMLCSMEGHLIHLQIRWCDLGAKLLVSYNLRMTPESSATKYEVLSFFFVEVITSKKGFQRHSFLLGFL